MEGIPHKKQSLYTVPVRSGHLEFQTLYATNDMETPSFTVNRLGAPNNSTLLVPGFFKIFFALYIIT